MYTTVYLIRHSIPFKEHRGLELIDDDILTWNMKSPLSIKGEEKAKEYFKKEEFNNIDVVWSSSYVRAMSTAKYLAYYNDVKVNVSSVFNERIHGINNWSELPSDFEKKQFEDKDFKVGYGESRREVTVRMLDGLNKVLDEYKGKNIAIVGHASSFAFLLSNWCDINYTGQCQYRFKEKVIFEGFWNYLETFKLVFDENNKIISIKNLYHNYVSEIK